MASFSTITIIPFLSVGGHSKDVRGEDLDQFTLFSPQSTLTLSEVTYMTLMCEENLGKHWSFISNGAFIHLQCLSTQCQIN